jgi:hypothetical protein
MVEDYIFIANGETRGQEVSDGPHDARRRKVASGVIVAADDKHAGMMAARLHDQVVQIQEVLVIAGEQSTIVADGVSKMNGVVFARQTDF